MNQKILTMAVCGAVATGALADPHVFTIYAQAPATALPGESITVEIWGQVQSPQWVQGTSMIAGFGIDVLGTGEISNVEMGQISEWAAGFGINGFVQGFNVVGTSGGQLHDGHWGDCWIGDCEGDRGNPILLFTILATAGEWGEMVFTPGNPNINGGLSFYPSWDDGLSIIGPNDAGTSLVLLSATVLIVPGPGVLVGSVLGLALMARRKR
ncbi:MAG: hypothetical protein KF757_12170 [Phycisphaeraceae bacterium]|nr:hypothetical protein [Phycisphaeraceae bacterium]MCW5762446.1 hypothetical protein [Phycisphaeraceae bacterium]